MQRALRQFYMKLNDEDDANNNNNISTVLYGTLRPYETDTITFHFTVEETEVKQVK